MIIIRRPNPAFFGNLPVSAMDSDTLSKPTGPACMNDDAQSCRRFVLVPSDATEVTAANGSANMSDQNGGGDKMDPGVILEKNPLHCRETSEMTSLLLDVASFKPDQLKIEIDNHVLTISGKRTNKLGDTFATHRRFALRADTYDEDTISANIDDGILEITIQKRVAPKSRQISITVGGKSTSLKKHQDDVGEDNNKEHVEQSKSGAVAAKNRPLRNVEEISVETVNDDDDDGKKNDDKSVTRNNEENSSSSSSKSHDDHWEKVAQA